MQPSAHVRVPDYWRAMAETIDADERDGKVLVLPLDDYYQMPTTWGFFGVDSIANLLIQHPVVQPKPDGYFGDVAGFKANVVAVETALLSGDLAPVPNLLDSIGVSEVIVRHDLVRGLPGRTLRRRRGAGAGDRTGPRPHEERGGTPRALAGRQRVQRLGPAVRPHPLGGPRAGRSIRGDRHGRDGQCRRPAEGEHPRADHSDRPGHRTGHRRHRGLASAGRWTPVHPPRPSGSPAGSTSSASVPAPRQSSPRTSRATCCGSPTRPECASTARSSPSAPTSRSPCPMARRSRPWPWARARCRWTGGAGTACLAPRARTSPGRPSPSAPRPPSPSWSDVRSRSTRPRCPTSTTATTTSRVRRASWGCASR